MNEEQENSVYLFLNEKHNFHIYTNAETYAEAMNIFDTAGFESRKEWKIFVKCGDQPA